MCIQKSYIFKCFRSIFTLYCNLPWATLLWLCLNNRSTDVKVFMFQKKIKKGVYKIKLLISICTEYNEFTIYLNTPSLAASYELFPSE